MAYSVFSKYYDILTSNIDYKARAGYFDSIIKKYKPDADILLDLACGTGSLTAELTLLGYDMIGVDSSADMLSVAMGKHSFSCKPILFLQQKAENLDLYGTIDACICALDSLNHLSGEEAFRLAVQRVSLFLNPGGVFVFDLNSLHKHRDILSDNTYVYEMEQVFCTWRNDYCPGDHSVEITLDFFEKTGKVYNRYTELFAERYFSPDTVESALSSCGLELVGIYEGDTLSPHDDSSERIVYVAIKK